MIKTFKSLLLASALLSGVSVHSARADLANDVSVEFNSPKPVYDAASRKFVVAGQLHNIASVPVQGPLSLVIDGFTPNKHSVVIDRSDGVLPDGKNYLVLYPQLELAAGQSVPFEFFLRYANPVSDDAVIVFDNLAGKAFKRSPPSTAKFGLDVHLLRIPAGNHPPVADAGGNLVSDVATPLLLDGSLSTDPDNDPITYSWKLLKKPQASSAQLLNPLSATPSLTGDVPGDYQASLVVSDGYVVSQADTVDIKMNAVAGVNQPPFISSTAPGSATATKNFNYQVLAGDPDGDSLTYSFAGVPPVGMTINASGMVSWLVPNTPHQMPSVTIRVDDGEYTVEQTFTIHILECSCP